MGIRTRLVAALMAAGTLTAVVGGTTASAAPASSVAPAPGDGKAPPAKGDKGPDKAILAKVAMSLHVTVEQLVTALQHLKQALAKGTSEREAVAAFAKELKVSVARAEQALDKLSGKDKPQPGVPEQAVELLAAELRISAGRARQVFDDLAKIKYKPGDIVDSPAFAALAKSLGLTPQRLLAVLRKVKEQVAKQVPGKPKPVGSPGK
jgi:hypothetical protein